MKPALVSPGRFIFTKVLLNPVTLLCIVALSGIIGVVATFDAPMYNARARRVESLQPARAAALEDRAVGSDVLLEGQISARAPTVYRSFVAYVREAYRSSSWSLLGGTADRWEVVAQATPPLRITLPDGEAAIANDDYGFDKTAFTLREAEPTWTKGAVQSRGFRPGDPVLVVGTVVAHGEVNAVAAEFLYAGTRADYLADMRRTASRSLPIGIALLIICGISLIALIWQVRRFLREVTAEQAAAAAEAQRAAQQARPRKRSAQARTQR